MGNIEFWNHGYVHKRFMQNGSMVSEFKGTGFDYQFEHISKAQDLAREKLGFEFTTFGAPYNHIDSNTLRVINEFPEIKVWLYANPDIYAGDNRICLDRIKTLNIEYPVHVPNFYHLWNNLYFHRNEDCIVIQGHPLSWDNQRFEEYKTMVEYLLKCGYEIKKPSDIQ